jgi:hypothetical protein
MSRQQKAVLSISLPKIQIDNYLKIHYIYILKGQFLQITK